MDKMDVIEISDLSFSRGTKPIFKSVDLCIRRGAITAIMGPSGTGKTTLLNIIGGQLAPDAGTVAVFGEPVHSLRQSQLYQLRRRMGVLFQEGGLFTDLNVYENVAFPLRQHTDLTESMIHDLVLMHLHVVGLRGASQLRIDELSGGMARRVALARAIVLGPEIMMYDEPFTGQDPIGRGVLLKLIRELNKTLGLTTILVSHDVHETTEIADYTYILSNGCVMAEGCPRQLIDDNEPAVHQFLHGLPDGPVRFQYPAGAYAEELGL